ncbi:iron-containing alcohol dehydrogenase [[Eubacterium] hominis]|uniref:iron-containing alcohol dehydrogenase n=1 Tax=[Eubacterium] hominis TaxID=2764325 RepID=UPI003A4E56EB
MSVLSYQLAGIHLLFGDDAMKELKQELINLKVTRPLLVTDHGVIDAGILKIVKDQLYYDGIPYEVFKEVKSDPLNTMVSKGVILYKEKHCDGVIAIGGGSSMDTAKCISIMSKHKGDILDYARSTVNHKTFEKRGCPIITIPTTSGTGSEVSQYAVITNEETHRKTTICTPYILSDTAILIPDFAKRMPPEVTAYTGMDALAHAVDAYTHKTAIEEDAMISDICAIKAISLIGKHLVQAYQHPEDLHARKQMMWASLFAGIALNIGAGESHAIGSMLSKYYGVCHGVSVGIPLPYCMEYNAKTCYERFANIAEALGCDIDKKDQIAAAFMGVNKVKDMMKQMNFPCMKDYIKSISEVESFAQECADNSCCTSNQRMNHKEAIIEVCRMALNA